jgi:hypothetical protein
MWTDGLSPEEIKERRRKEGVFTPLLERLGLNNGDNGEEERVLAPEEKTRLLTEAVEDLLLPRIRGITAPQVVKEEPLKYIPADRGNGALELLAAAKHSIYATHFTPAEFSARYVELQKQKVEGGLIFERLVYVHQEHHPQRYKWLDEFLDKDGTPIKNYREYEIERSPLFLPRDFMVIDEKWVLFWFKNGDEEEMFIFSESKEIAEFFLNMWKALTPQEGCISMEMKFTVSRSRHK